MEEQASVENEENEVDLSNNSNQSDLPPLPLKSANTEEHKAKGKKKKKKKPSGDGDPDDDDDGTDSGTGENISEEEDEDEETETETGTGGDQDENELVWLKQEEKIVHNPVFKPANIKFFKPLKEHPEGPNKINRSPWQQMADFFMHGAKGAMIKNGEVPIKARVMDKILLGLGFKSLKKDIVIQQLAQKFWTQKFKGKGTNFNLLNTERFLQKINQKERRMFKKQEQQNMFTEQLKTERKRVSDLLLKTNQESKQRNTEKSILKSQFELTKQTPQQQFEPTKQTSQQQFELTKQTPQQQFEPIKQTPQQQFEPTKQTPQQQFELIKQTPQQQFELIKQTSQQQFELTKQTPQQQFEPIQETERKKTESEHQSSLKAKIEQAVQLSEQQPVTPEVKTLPEKRPEPVETEKNKIKVSLSLPEQQTHEQKLEKQQKQNRQEFHDNSIMQQLQIQNIIQSQTQTQIQQQQIIQEQMNNIMSLRQHEIPLHQPINKPGFNRIGREDELTPSQQSAVSIEASKRVTENALKNQETTGSSLDNSGNNITAENISDTQEAVENLPLEMNGNGNIGR